MNCLFDNFVLCCKAPTDNVIHEFHEWRSRFMPDDPQPRMARPALARLNELPKILADGYGMLAYSTLQNGLSMVLANDSALLTGLVTASEGAKEGCLLSLYSEEPLNFYLEIYIGGDLVRKVVSQRERDGEVHAYEYGGGFPCENRAAIAALIGGFPVGRDVVDSYCDHFGASHPGMMCAEGDSAVWRVLPVGANPGVSGGLQMCLYDAVQERERTRCAINAFASATRGKLAKRLKTLGAKLRRISDAADVEVLVLPEEPIFRQFDGEHSLILDRPDDVVSWEAFGASLMADPITSSISNGLDIRIIGADRCGRVFVRVLESQGRDRVTGPTEKTPFERVFAWIGGSFDSPALRPF